MSTLNRIALLTGVSGFDFSEALAMWHPFAIIAWAAAGGACLALVVVALTGGRENPIERRVKHIADGQYPR